MAEPRLRCGECGRKRPESETALVHGKAQGNYRRASRRTFRRVCRCCTQERVNYARAGQASGLNTPVNGGGVEWAQAARVFGITITGLRLSQMSDRVAE